MRRMIKSLQQLLELRVLQSRVGWRLLCMFVLCSLLPMVGLAFFAFHHVTAQLSAQADSRLHQSVKALGMSLYERLLFLETDLTIIAAQLNAHTPPALDSALRGLEERLRTHFTGFVVLDERAQTLTSQWEPPRLPRLSDGQRQHLMDGKTLLLVQPQPAAFATVLMVHALHPPQLDQGLLVSALHPTYLWQGAEGSFVPMTELHVLSGSATPLYVSLPNALPWREIKTASQDNPNSGGLHWEHGGDMYQGHYWTLFLQPHFFCPSWMLLLSQTHAEIQGPLRHFTSIYLLGTLFTFWLVLLLSMQQLRKQLVPIGQLKEATQRIAKRDFRTRVTIHSQDEFAELGAAFNDMAHNLDSYVRVMAMMNWVSTTLPVEKDTTRFLRLIVSSAKELTNADGGALYIVEADHLMLSLLCIDSLNLDLHHPTADMHIPLYDAAGQANTSIAASYAVLTGAPVNLPDIYHTAGVPCSGNHAFDSRHGYRSQSCLTVPMRNQEHEIIGVLQCLNARDRHSDSIVAFSDDDQRLVESLASQAAVALTRHALLASLRLSEKRYRDVVENSPGAICMHDLNGVLTFANHALAQPLGYEPADMVGRNLGEFLAPNVQSEFTEYLRRCTQEHCTNGHVRFLTKDGKERVLIYRSLCYEEAGKPPYVIVHAQDITEQRQLEMQLQQAQKMQAIGTLAGGIAHDFNNILTSVIGYSELVLDDIPPDSLVWENVQAVLVAGHRAKDLVQQILTFSRQGDAERKPLELHLIVKEVLKLLRASLPSTIDIRVRLATTAGQVLADPTQMHQVLMNLCTNAGHAMKDTGGVLEVSLDTLQVDAAFVQAHPTFTPGPYARLTVKDTGHGMPPEVLARIFEPFFTTKGVGEGTGLGLSVVHGIVISHGGNITVESHSGTGTTFAVYLPCIEPTAASATATSDATPGGSERILFVDDEVAIAGLAQQMLARLGYQVVVHTNSLAALEAFRVDPQAFDLVITDHTMPHLRGDHLAREIQQCRADIPIILCTGFSEVGHAGPGQALGVDAVCMKPLTIQTLGTIIRHVLAA